LERLPQHEQLLGRTHRVTAQATSRVAATVDQSLEVSFQMRPAPLQPPERPIHPGTIAVDHTRISLSQPIRKNIGSPDARSSNALAMRAPRRAPYGWAVGTASERVGGRSRSECLEPELSSHDPNASVARRTSRAHMATAELTCARPEAGSTSYAA